LHIVLTAITSCNLGAVKTLSFHSNRKTMGSCSGPANFGQKQARISGPKLSLDGRPALRREPAGCI
jgi:hypothetical protein